MRDVNAHLTLEEILLVLRPEDGGVDSHSLQAVRSHLAQCAECARALDRYRGIMAKLNPFNRRGEAAVSDQCPRPDVWVQVATGLLPNDEVLDHLEHAAMCSSCSAHLREALEIVGASAPPELKLQQALQTNTPARQKSLAAEMAARSRQVLQSEARGGSPQMVRPIPFVSKPSRSLRLPIWAYGAAAAVLIAGVALGVFGGRGSGSTERLLAQAYAQQRTVELRIPGAGYGPIRVERGQKQSQMSSPGALLEAETAIKRGLEQHPDDPSLLRQKAEADLLNWDYQPAIETLGHALRLQPQSSKLLVDLATAHFERAEATDTPADYESALQYLGDALRLFPKDPAALFNRAIVYERLFLYSSAIVDWELLLTIEGDAGWKQEAQKRLNDLRTRQQRHSARDAPDHLTPAEFKTAVEKKTTLDPEQYIELTERKILPNIFHANLQDQNYQLAGLLARYFESSHSDHFLTDLLLASDRPGFHEAVQLLGETSSTNSTAHYEDAYLQATQTIVAFRRLNNQAGTLAARFEQVYALQLESQANKCTTMASALAGAARQRGYTWLEIQSLLEQAICSNMQGNLGDAKEIAQQASRLAKRSDYSGFYLRGLMILATLESEAGNESMAWATIREGLERYWNGALPPMRGYSFYTLLRLMAEHLGHWNVQFAAAYEAVGFFSNISNRVVQAVERSYLADAALHLGETKIAAEQFALAGQLFSASPQTSSVRWRELEAKIGLAKAQSLESNGTKDSFATLLAYLPEVKQLSNRYVESQYYNTLAELKIRVGDWQTAEQFLLTAIHLADNGLSSLSTWQERLTWIDQQQRTYALMSESLLRAGRQAAALETWEHFLAAQPGPSQRHESSRDFHTVESPASVISLKEKPAGQTEILTYALLPDGVIIWVHDQEQIHSVFVPVLLSDLQRTAENFIAECSRPDSNLPLLRSDAQTLYSWLIGPVRRWLPSAGHLVVEPHGILNVLPFEALMNTSETYLGAQYAITMSPGLIAQEHAAVRPAIGAADHALIVAAPADSSGSLEPPPGALTEANEVAQQFSQPTVLPGSKARSSTIEREIPRSSVFHFAGHATLGRSGAAMLLADGNLSIAGGRKHPAHNASHSLSGLKLAVFSACGTAKPSEAAQSDSLVTEFLHAGAPNVVASRWNVDSMATTEFMIQFYRSVLSGHEVADALQITARDFRKTAGWIHPYYWAAFSTFGHS